MKETTREAGRLMGLVRTRPSREILSGDSADVYFARAATILEREGLDPVVTMELFARQDAVLCGIEEAKNLLGHVLAEADLAETKIEALDDRDAIGPKEVVLRIQARYRQVGLYETAMLGMLAQSTGWATAARECVEVADPMPVISFGARHVHPDITDVLDYAAIVGGCVGASTPAGARLAGLSPTGTMPHSLVLIFGDTVEAALAFDRDIGPEVPRIVLVDTFRDEAEEALRVAHALGDRLYGIRLDTPAERGRVTADLVHEIRARLDLEGFRHVKIVVSGGLNPDRIRYFKEAGAPVDSYAVGSYISGATPIDFTCDIKEIDGKPIACLADAVGCICGSVGSAPRGRVMQPTASLRDLSHVSRLAVPTALAIRATICAWMIRSTTASRPTSCSSAGTTCSRSAIMRRRRSSSSARRGSSPGRRRSSKPSGGRSTTRASTTGRGRHLLSCSK
jgi:nicotinate phosphoribosyltransferase